MTKLLLTTLLVIPSLLSFSQKSAELESRGGFKDIKLGTLIDSVAGHKLKKEFTEKGNVFTSAYYSVDNPEYMSIGDIKVNEIEIETYKNLISKITVVTEKDSRLMKAMENVLGKATFNAKEHYYFWAGETLVLTFESHGKKELKLVYKSYTIPKLMKEDREKKVETISNDF